MPVSLAPLTRTAQRARRMRRMGVVAGLACLFVVFCAVARQLGLLVAPAGVFVVMFGLWLAGFLGAVELVRRDHPLAARDPGVTLALWLWANAGILFAIGCALPEVRVMLLSGFLVGALFAAQRLPMRLVIVVNVLTLLAYAAMLTAQAVKRGVPLDLAFEVLAFAGLAVVLTVGVVFSSQVAALRRQLGERNAELAAALERVRQLAIRDELTGLYNRRFLMDALQQQKSLADRGSHGFAVAYLDLDYFKRVNDVLGHGKGDQILRMFADIACEAVREADLVARFGGEEFVIVLVGADLVRAEIVAERIRRGLANAPIAGADGAFNVTTSVGLAEYRSVEPIEQTLARADAALYAAKRDGRNRVVVGGR